MLDYRNLLILSYFYQYKKGYLISELQDYLGFTSLQLDERFFYLMDNNFLEYIKNLIKITKEGIQLVLNNNMESFPFRVDKITYPINNDKIISIDDIYIPKNFLKKVNK
jgi:hypothetical protein